MLLSEGQMSDYKGAALMLPVLPKARELLGDKGYDADWFRQALAERGITAAYRPDPIARSLSTTTANSIASGTKSRTCSEGSRTGGAFTLATTDAPTPSCPPSPSRPQSFSGSDQ
jgi:transposase